ncbi:MAG: DNA-3-methyladenine glycosylase [Trueperaceae bacterium]
MPLPTGPSAPGELEPLPRAWFARPADAVAPALLGCVLSVRAADGTVRTARIVETEAYVGEADRASHASRGRTPRTATMYGPPGTAYVYLVYGLHHLFNVVTEAVGEPHAVLVRAVEPIDFDARTHGPGLTTVALGIQRSDDASDLLHGRIRIAAGTAPQWVAVGPRIGVDYAGDWAHAPLRFGDAGSERLSRRFP